MIRFFTIVALFVAFAPLSITAQAKTYDKDYFGETIIHKAVFEDTLIHLARNNGLGFVEVRAANPTLDAWIPGAGARITLPKQHILPDAPRKGLVINLAEMRIYYFKNPGEAPQTYPISIGRDGLQTPTGSTTIVRKKEGPTWRPTKRMREEDPTLPVSVPPGPENPLGTHALYLGWPQYLIHGTNKPYGIGRRVSSGCMRMYPEDVKKLFPQVPVGTPVTVVDQSVKVGWIDDSLYIEVSPTQEQALQIEEQKEVTPYVLTPLDRKRIEIKAGDRIDEIDWIRVEDAIANYRGVPVSILGFSRQAFDEGNGNLSAILDDLAQEESAIAKIEPAAGGSIINENKQELVTRAGLSVINFDDAYHVE